MNIQDVRTLFDYNVWANKRILAATAGISQEEYTVPAANGWGSLRGVLFHTFEAEYSWRFLCQHGRFAPEILEPDYPTFDDLLAGWQAEEAARQEYLAGLSDALSSEDQALLQFAAIDLQFCEADGTRIRSWEPALVIETCGEAAAELLLSGCGEIL